MNASLDELRNLLLSTLKMEGSRHSKLEKADILEMTVEHLRSIQRQKMSGDYHASFLIHLTVVVLCHIHY
jgi:hypothetical protein